MAESDVEGEIPGLTPETEDEETKVGEVEPEIDVDADESDDEEPDVAEVSLTDDDLSGGGDLFAGIEGASEDGDDEEEIADPLDALDSRGEAMEDAINDGAARLAVVGLDDADDLESEMRDVFEAFRLGYFGAGFVEEYILIEDDDSIDPAWGFAGAAFCCMAVCLWMRPDGDEQMARMKHAVSKIGGTA